MSGTYGDSREKRFKAYYERVGRPPFAPDFFEKLLMVMADPGGCMQHRVLAWAIYRAPGNQNEFAIYLGTDRHGRAEEILLTQADCALDLAWLEAGYPAEWLDARRPVWQAEVARRGVQPLDKSVISRAVACNRNRGTMAPRDGQKLLPAVSTDPAKVALSRELFRSHKQRSAEFSTFMERWRVAHSRESEELAVARFTVERIRKLALSDYRKEKRSAAPETKRVRSYNLSESSINEGPPPPVESTDSVGLPREAKAEEEAPPALQPEVLPPAQPKTLTPAMPAMPPADPPSYATLKRLYPSWRFDEPKSKPLFEALTTEDKTRVCDALAFAPQSPAARGMITSVTMEMCETREQLVYMVKRALCLHSRWDTCGVPGQAAALTELSVNYAESSSPPLTRPPNSASQTAANAQCL